MLFLYFKGEKMSWLFLTVSCILIWGITDILYKKSSDMSDPRSHFKGLIWVGIVMAAAGAVLAVFSETLSDSIKMLPQNLYLIPASILYPVALIFGLIGKKHLDASVVSPLENIDGAMAAIILYFYFMIFGYDKTTGNIGILDIIGTLTIILGVVLLGFQEHKLSKQEAHIPEDKRKHRLGALVLIFPIIYNLVDAVSMVAIGITVNEETTNSIPDIDFLIFESLGFAAVAAVSWLYLLIAEKHFYNPFKKGETMRGCAAIGETLGTITFIFAVAKNPILTAPITSSYCLVTIAAAHIFLKEKLGRRQYICLAFLLTGIALLGISEVIKG